MADVAQLHALVDRAYEKYNSRIMSWREFVQELDGSERDAVMIGKFHAEVTNGGLEQWITNGYHEDFELLAEALDRIDTENSRRVLEMAAYAFNHAGEVLITTDDETSLVISFCDKWDSDYYKFCDAFLLEVARALL